MQAFYLNLDTKLAKCVSNMVAQTDVKNSSHNPKVYFIVLLRLSFRNRFRGCYGEILPCNFQESQQELPK